MGAQQMSDSQDCSNVFCDRKRAHSGPCNPGRPGELNELLKQTHWQYQRENLEICLKLIEAPSNTASAAFGFPPARMLCGKPMPCEIHQDDSK